MTSPSLVRALVRPRAAIAAAVGAAPLIGLALSPSSLLGSVVLVSIALLAALHGLGRIVGWLAGDDEAPAVLAIAWGVGAYVALAGGLLAVDALHATARLAVIALGCGCGALWLAHRVDHVVERIAAIRRAPAWLVVAWLLVAGLGAIHVLGAAGRWSSTFADADGSRLDALRRLDDTGALGDPVSLSRAAGLGAQIALDALAGATGEARTSHLVDDGLLFALALALLVAGARRLDRVGLAALAVPLLIAAIPEIGDDVAPHGSILVLILASAATLARADERQSRRLGLVLVLLVAALASVRHAGLAFAVVMLAALARRATWPGVMRCLGVAALVIGPYAIAAVRAWSVGPRDPAAIAALSSGASRLLPWLAAGAFAALLVRLAAPRATPGDRALATTLLAASAMIAAAGALTPTPAVAIQVVVPVATAIVAALALVALATDRESDTRSLVLVAMVVVALAATLTLRRFAAGTPLLSWPGRFAMMLGDARALGGVIPVGPAGPAGPARAYDRALAAIPAGARVGIWVERADQVPHGGHAIVDLWTEPARQCAAGLARAPRAWAPLPAACARVERLLAAVAPRYLLVSAAALEPAETRFARGCWLRAGCSHPLARLAASGTVVYDHDGARVIELGGQGAAASP